MSFRAATTASVAGLSRISTVVLTAVLASACASARIAPEGRLTPVKDRVTDEAIARDLALFDAYDRRISAAAPSPTAAQKYVAARASEYVRIAREAYERNDRTDFIEDALGWADADLATLERNAATQAVTSAVAMPKGTQRVGDDVWTKVDGLRRDVAALSTPEDVARAEGQLIRAGHHFLAGPACVEETPLVLANRLADIADRTRIPVLPPPVPVEEPRPEPPRDCAAPERLAGVPTNVHFALDKSLLASASREVLDRMVEKLAPYPGIHVVLAGHTDPRATDAYNQALSERRVHAVREYLISKGMAPRRLETFAYGEQRLLVPGESVRDHARNRRVDISYTLCDGSEVPTVEQLNDLQLEAARRKRSAILEKD